MTTAKKRPAPTETEGDDELLPLPTIVEAAGKTWNFRLRTNELCDIEMALDKGYMDIARSMFVNGHVGAMRAIARHSFYELDGSRPTDTEAGLIIDVVKGPVIRDAFTRVIRDLITRHEGRL
ncbi:hypothetical protein [Sphingobium ummariense]